MKMRMMRSIKRFFGLYLLLDLLLMIAMYLKGGLLWLLNAQVAFIASLLVTFASFYAYRKMVDHKASDEGALLYEERDLLDQIEDPHALYEEQADTPESFKEVIAEEKAKLRSLKTTAVHLKTSTNGHRSAGFICSRSFR